MINVLNRWFIQLDYGDFDVQSQGYLLIVSYWEYIVSMTMDISAHAQSEYEKSVALCWRKKSLD